MYTFGEDFKHTLNIGPWTDNIKSYLGDKHFTKRSPDSNFLIDGHEQCMSFFKKQQLASFVIFLEYLKSKAYFK